MAPRDDLARFDAMFRAGQRDAPPPISPSQLRRARRRRRVSGIVGTVVTLLILGMIGGYVYGTLNAPVAAAKGVTHLPDAAPGPAVSLTMPAGESAISVAGGDAYLGAGASGILASSGGDDPLPIASITKLITAMVVLDRKPITSGEGPTLTFSKDDHALYDKYYVQNATIVAMPTGSSMTEHDALETMLVASASNYAEAVSTWAFGSQPAFLSAARSWLKKNGLTSIRVYDPTGIDPRNVATPSDLIGLGKLAKANPVVSSIAAMPALDIQGVDRVTNTNPMLGSDGVDGLKTGTLVGSVTNLLFSGTADVGTGAPLAFVGVVLTSGDRGALVDSVRALIGSLKNGFHDVQVAKQGTVVGTYTTAWGESASMELNGDATLRTWSDTPITVTMTKPKLGDGRKGEEVGVVTYTAGPNTVTVDVVLDGRIRPPSAWWRLTHPSQTLWPALGF